MRRSVLLILATVVLICTGLFIYTYLQPPVPKKPKGSLGAINKQRPQLNDAMRGLGDGANAWVKRYDPKTGELASQFKSRTYQPRKDGTVDVGEPEAEFFSNDGRQRIRINGNTGNVVMNLGPEDKSSNSNAFQSQGSPAMPSRGKLHDVVITVFEPVDATEPMLTATMNNAAFDNDTFRVNTEAFTDEKGNNTPADEVPVKVRGRDYDFDGRGLTVLWNERDRKLQLLEIAHGESLVIKNPSALSAPGMSPSTPSSTQATQPSARAVVPLRITDGMLASADPTAHRLILAAAKPKPAAKAARKPAPGAAARKRHPATTTAPATAPTTRPKTIRDLSPVVYRANFEQDVRIFQGDDLVATADHMHVDWLQEQEKTSSTQPAPAPPKDSADKSPAAGGSSPSPTTHPAGSSRRRSAASAPTSQNSGDLSATTQPTTKPVTVKWTGKLRVVPIDNAPVATMTPGKAIVHLIGAPATLIRDTMHAYCGQAIFNSADNSAALLPSKKVPQVTMTGERGMKVVTPHVQYAEPSVGPHTATLIGPSMADLPVEGDDPTQRAMMNTSWTKTCVLKMVGAADHAVLQEADLDGDVKVLHPKMRLTSDALVLGFDPAPATTRPAKPQAATLPTTIATTVATAEPTTQSTTRPATKPSDTVSASLREIVATGNAHCTMIDDQNPREMDAERLHVTLGQSSDGQMYPKIVDADGHVHTEETSYTIENDESIESVRTMDAGHMTARLAPSTRPGITKPTTQTLAADPTTSPTTSPPTIATTLATTQKSRSTSQPFGGANLKLVSLLATDNVRLTAPDDTVATAETLHAETVDGQLRYTLIGDPDATLSSNKSGNSKTMIIGPRIVFDPDRNIAQVIGGGWALGADPDKPLQTMHLEWTGDANIDGNTNLIDVDRDVVIHSIEADGTRNQATAHHLQAILTTKPTTQATDATQPGAAQPAAQNAKPQAAGDLQTTSFLKDKEVSAGILTGDVKIRSELLNKDGSLARGMLLEAEKVTFDQLAGRMEVPVQGSLLYQDHRTPATEPTTGPTTNPSTHPSTALSTTQPTMRPATTRAAHHKPATTSTSGPGDSRGETAFGWQKSLVYERALQKATMTGDVNVVHKPEDESGMPFRVTGQTLIAEFQPKEPTTRPAAPAAEKPATHPASTEPGDQMGKLRMIDVSGDVHVTSPRLDVDASDLTFNPIDQVLTAHGTPEHPVTVFDHEHGSQQTATDLYWNLQNDTIRMKNATGKVRN